MGAMQPGRPVLQKRFSRAALVKFMANLPGCRVGLEVCGGANYWSRTLQAFGPKVALMADDNWRTPRMTAARAEAPCNSLFAAMFIPPPFLQSHDSTILRMFSSLMIR